MGNNLALGLFAAVALAEALRALAALHAVRALGIIPHWHLADADVSGTSKLQLSWIQMLRRYGIN